jgi:C-terminal processing protease CtpA/Prc
MSCLNDSVFYYYKRRTSLIKPILKFEKKGNVYEIIGKNAWVGKVIPAQQQYRGNVFVLMNGYCVSAAAEFIGHLKNSNRAIFIGEEAGGNPVVFIGGQTLLVDLPHTHVTGVIPLHLNEMNVRLKNTGHGVTPDYEVRPSIKDILLEKDVEMEFALKLIKER